MKSTLPFISILIPIRNEAAYIQRCLDAVLAQDYPPERIEILIADGMSEDSTREIIQDIRNQHPNIHLIDNPKRIVSTGLNKLIPKAKGDILIRVDGHCVIAPDYVSKCVKHIQEDQVDSVGGPMHTIGEDLISEIIAAAMSSKFGVGGSSFRTEKGRTKLVDTVPFPAYTHQIIDRVGLYDEELIRNQDDEYNYRIRKAGGKILLAADVTSTYFSRGSLRKLWRQFFQYGFFKVRVLQKHPRQMSPRQFVPASFVLTMIIGVFLSILFTWGWLVLTGLISIYLLSNVAASLITCARKGWQYIWLLPVSFATIHFSYGLGFLWGLIKFWNRWHDKVGKVPVHKKEN